MNVLFDLYGTLIDIHTDESKEKFWKKLALKTKDFKEYDYQELKTEYLKACEYFHQFKEYILFCLLTKFKTIFMIFFCFSFCVE